MANDIPPSESLDGLARKVVEYSEHFRALVEKLKQRTLSDEDWAGIEALVDVQNFQRHGVFLGDVMEKSTWAEYKAIINQYGAMTDWEGTLRRITETPGLVFLELEERNTRDGVTDISNTVTIYQFNEQNKLVKLDVYIGPVGKRPAS